MSRIGRSPVPVASGVEVNINGSTVEVKGAKGTLSHEVPEGISVALDGETVVVSRASDERDQRALHGLTRALINNMVVGVSEGYRKDLEIVGVGYRCQAKGSNALEFQLGFSHPVNLEAPDGISFEVPTQTQISVLGIDKQAVGQVAANIRALKKPEPYKGKGIRYVGERVIRKAGKAGK